MGRRKIIRGKLLPPRIAGMSLEAATVAVSELAGVPCERLCGFILLAVSHPEDHPGGHELGIIWPPDLPAGWAARWLEAAARDVKENPR